MIDLLVGEPIAHGVNPIELGDGAEISITPSGNVPGNPGELLSSQRARDLIAELAANFDVVIVDSAPILPVADSLALAGAVDAVLFVTQSRRATRRNIVEALERLGRVHAPVVGIVLNQAKKGGGAGSYVYGYGGYGQAYGSSASIPVAGQPPQPTSADITPPEGADVPPGSGAELPIRSTR